MGAYHETDADSALSSFTPFYERGAPGTLFRDWDTEAWRGQELAKVTQAGKRAGR